ncbi:unnamed protein product [Dovyalis caffra]|uniref:Uncharacterized protein n=1 Tax=Dovyalis caffra TaxID=77055 RepID=A0AAV1RLM6_9ROSI|nr:unnamed protein product [Dovyalis caffra]
MKKVMDKQGKLRIQNREPREISSHLRLEGGNLDALLSTQERITISPSGRARQALTREVGRYNSRDVVAIEAQGDPIPIIKGRHPSTVNKDICKEALLTIDLNKITHHNKRGGGGGGEGEET